MQIKEKVFNFILQRGLYVVAGFLIIIVAHIIASILKSLIIRQANQTKTIIKNKDDQLQKEKIHLLFYIIAQIVYFSIMIVSFMIIMQDLGIQAASIITLLGAIGIAIGLGFQGILSDIAAGVVLAIFQPYSIGDIIEVDGIEGKVIDFNLIQTILQRSSTKTKIIIPNRQIIDSAIENHTTFDRKIIDIDILVSNKITDFDKVLSIISEEVNKTPEVLKDPPPSYGVIDMSDVGTKIRVKLTIKSSQYPDIILKLQLIIRQVLAKNNVELVDPY